MTARIVVGVSGAGSNLRALHAAARRGELGADIVLAFADRPCPAIDWANEAGLATRVIDGGLDDDHVRATFNGGIGMAVVVASEAAPMTLAHLEAAGIAAWVIGEVVQASEQDGARYAERSPQ